jgi:hypothetical protein
VTHETVSAALYSLRAQINEVLGMMKDAAKHATQEDTAALLVQYSIRLAQLEGAYITLQEHAPTLVTLSQQYPVPPVAPEESSEDEDEEEERVIISEGMSKTFDRVAKIHADSTAATEEAEE